MFVYIDESGIHKPFGHSSFALVFVSVKKSDGFDRRILQIEEEIGSDRDGFIGRVRIGKNGSSFSNVFLTWIGMPKSVSLKIRLTLMKNWNG